MGMRSFGMRRFMMVRRRFNVCCMRGGIGAIDVRVIERVSGNVYRRATQPTQQSGALFFPSSSRIRDKSLKINSLAKRFQGIGRG